MAKNRIAGLSIEIDGDASKFNKELSNTNKSIKTTKDQLKDVERLLKLDPKNTELLRQKQELLAKSIEETKGKLTLLKDAEKQAQEQFKQGKISQEQYDALKREIVETEEQLKSLEDQAKEVGTSMSRAFENAGQKMQDFGQKATNAGKKLLPLTAGVAAIGGASIKAFNEVDDGLDTIIKKTGAMGDAAEELSENFRNVYGDFPATSVEVGEAIGELNTRFGFTGSKLEDASVKFLKFAKINDTDVNGAVQLVSRAMGDAGIEAEDYGSILDQLTVAAQASGISIDKLTENITKYGAPMRGLGFDTQASIAIFAQWEKAGVNTEIAFSGMKKAISVWMKSGKDAKKEFASFVAGVQDGSISAQEALEVFGAKAGPDLVDAIQQGRFSYEDFMKVIQNSYGMVDDTFEGIRDPIDDTTTAMNNAKIALADIGDTLQQTLAPIIQVVSNKLKEFSNWFRGLSDEQRQMVITIGGLVAALGPVLIIIGKLSTGIGAVSKLIGSFSKTVLPALSKALSLVMAHPIIATISLVIGAIVLLWNNCEWFRDGVINILQSIGKWFSDVWNGIIELFTVKIPEAFNSVTEWLTNLFTTDWSEAFGFIGELMNAFFANISNIVEAIKRTFSGVIDFFTGIFTGDWSKAWDGIVNIFGGIWDRMVAIVKWPVNAIIGIINGLIDAINNVIGGLNNLAIDIPDWIPGIGGQRWGINIPYIGKLAYLAKGGILSRGSAIVGENGPELLSIVSGGRAQVTPLTGTQASSAINNAGVRAGGYSVVIQEFNNYDTAVDSPRLIRQISEGLQKDMMRKARATG